MNVLLAGEGPDELGQWAEHPSYREDPPRLGILEALLRRVRDDGWRVRDGVRWKGHPALPAGRLPERRDQEGDATTVPRR